MIDKKTWIIGYGDIGQRVATLYRDTLSKSLHVSIRNETSRQQAEQDKQHPYYIELDDEQSSLPEEITGNLFYFAPPPRTGQNDSRIANFLQKLSTQKKQPKRIVLISTTGVYGDCNGNWVDESCDIKPTADRAHRRANAEQHVIQWAKKNKTEYIILRVPGIYAQDRLPIVRLKKGLPVVKESESPWANRIHADDLAMICYKAMRSDKKAEIYNVSDGNPSTMTSYFDAVADYAGLSRPPHISLKQAEEELSKGMMSYMKESRRISNKNLLADLDIQLRYPSLRDGLK